MGKEISNERQKPFQDWIEGVTNEKTRIYIQERVIRQMDWYYTKCNTYKAKHQHWMTASIMISGIIPVASVFANNSIIFKVLIASLGAAVTGINTYLSYQNYKNLWNTYRISREYLLSTLYLYFNHAGIFGMETDQDKRDIMLIDACEKYFQQEVAGWWEIMK